MLVLSIHLHHCQGGPPPSTLSSRPKRTRISCHAALDMAACAAFRKESRMKFANANNSIGNPGERSGRDLQFHLPAQRKPGGESPPGSVSPSTQTADPSATVGMTKWRVAMHLGCGGRGWTEPAQPIDSKSLRVSIPIPPFPRAQSGFKTTLLPMTPGRAAESLATTHQP